MWEMYPATKAALLPAQTGQMRMGLQHRACAVAYPFEVEGREVVVLPGTLRDGPHVGGGRSQQEVPHVAGDDGAGDSSGGIAGETYVRGQVRHVSYGPLP